MTEVLCREWLSKNDIFFKNQGRHILLFVDNFVGHSSNVQLTNVKIIFFPATQNCTSKLQPLDQDIITNYKCIYKATMVDKTVLNIDEGLDVPKTTIKDAILLTANSWNQISSTCIQNCFRKYGFIDKDSQRNEAEIEVPVAESLASDAIIIMEKKGYISHNFNWAAYVANDTDLVTF